MESTPEQENAPMRCVVLESPYAGDIERNVAYARDCLRHSLSLGEAPIASHLLYTQVLDDDVPSERSHGIAAGTSWNAIADAIVVYTDLGITKGMEEGILRARRHGKTIEFRSLEEDKSRDTIF